MTMRAEQSERIGRPTHRGHDDSLAASPAARDDQPARTSRHAAEAGPKVLPASDAQPREVLARITRTAQASNHSHLAHSKPAAIRPQTADMIDAFRTRLIERIGAAAVSRHLTDDTHIDLQDTHVAVAVASNFQKNLLERRFASAMAKIAAELGLEGVRIGLQPSPQASPQHTPSAPSQRATNHPRHRATAKAARTLSEQRYQLSQFVVGSANRMAYAAAKRLATEPDGRAFSPLFIHGQSGLGKTHLLHGAAQLFRHARPGAHVRVTTAETFTNAYIHAVRANDIEKFRRAYRGLDLLCIDDVHFFSGKVSTQSELQHTFDAIDLEGACVMLASDAHPRQLEQLSDSLRSRLMSGAVVRIEPPDEHLRRELIDRLAARKGVMLTDDAAALLADRAGVGHHVSVREIEGMLTQVIAVAKLLPEFLGDGSTIGLLAVKRALGLGEWTHAAPAARDRKPVRLDDILTQVCNALNVERTDLFSSSRHRKVVLARSLMAYLAKDMTTRSFPEIARAMRRPTHSTIVAARKRFITQLEAGEVVSVGSAVDGLTYSQLAQRIAAEIQSPRS